MHTSGIPGFPGLTGGIRIHFQLLVKCSHTTGQTVFPYPSGFHRFLLFFQFFSMWIKFFPMNLFLPDWFLKASFATAPKFPLGTTNSADFLHDF
ncbi:MAG: hypothetical protein Greene07147_916 [Parcubacteria group bacterium Greene0714_7]|nr:MAG: hypothetical protein Greene041614_1061 [Parcubacteria group bacterium Greene0416_14]TSC99895.1 MAG: hypothetical protein Greene101415_1045 [Parcubacteria group bacterium Greene1014_15]TSD04793.1 MAG: hypothetical protein Greene07147_916 [Parcubacteria group bacterium Greene0714_7]